MNKAIYICTVAALVLASCSNDEVIERAKENVISFRSVVGLNTRAQNITQDMLEKNGMYVTTFDENGSLVYSETHYELSGGVWMANPAKSWGAYDKLSFILTSPKLAEFNANYTLTTDKIANTYVTVEEDIPAQKDYVVAHLTDVSKTDGAVPVSLKHVFSSVEIRAKNTNSAYTYRVKGIRLSGVNSQAIVDLSKESAECDIVTNTSVKSYELINDIPITLNRDAQSIMGIAQNAILPPQPGDGILIETWDGKSAITTPDKAYISVLINLTATAGAIIYPASSGSTDDTRTYGWVAVPVTFEWESGKKYVYTLDFSEGAGRVDPYNPGTDVNPGGEDPDKAKDPDKAQPVLGGRIRFGVDVTEWLPNSKDVLLKDGDKFYVTVDDWGSETNGATVE